MSSAADQLAKFKSAIATPEVPMLGPQCRPGTMAEADLLRRLESFFGESKTPEHVRSLLRSAALLWHDHLDASHNISQGIDTRDGSWLHGIMHRREPDYGNAKYWFHRVGQHPAFAKLTERARSVAASRQSAADKDSDGGSLPRSRYEDWDPFAFIDECEAAEQGNDAETVAALRQRQAAEFDVLVEHILQSA